MKEYYFTFGQQYRHEEHPNGGHPDGWFTIVAPDIDAAVGRMFDECKEQWAMVYDKQPDRCNFPKGELKRFVVKGNP